METTEKRRRRFKPKAAVVVGDLADPNYDAEDVWYVPSYYLQHSCTLGMKRIHNHPEVEALISFHRDMMGHSVLTDVMTAVQNGAHYAAGDRATFPVPHALFDTYTVEFRESTNCYGPCLRAVVLGMEEAFQALPTAEADAAISAYPDRIDPCSTI